jgi:hypothetical protein
MSTEPKENQDQETKEQTEFTPEEAKEYGAFSEDAISEEDAIESRD